MESLDILWRVVLFFLGLSSIIIAFIFVSYSINKKVVHEIDHDLENVILNADILPAKTDPKWVRIIEFFIVCFFLFLLLPLLIVVAILIKIESKGPIFNRSSHLGLSGTPFQLITFRTFKLEPVDRKGSSIQKHKTSSTKFGLFLVRTSISELPIFFNVLYGSVSLVGRSLYLSDPKNLAEVPQEYKPIILSVKPGLASLSTIGVWRKRIKPDQMYILDTFYVERKNRLFDLKVFVSSIVILSLNEY